MRFALALLGFLVLGCTGLVRTPEPRTSERTLSRRSIDLRRHPQAVCNDGSTPVFYVRRGADRDRWVVWFQGGQACATAEDCARRPRPLTSSEPWQRVDALDATHDPIPPDSRIGGLLSASPEHNPDFHAWNHVMLVYCSSDDWAGDRAASADTFGLHFRGSRIAEAMLDALADPAIVGAPGIRDAEQVLFAGSSAGAAGLRNNLDRLAAALPGVEVRAFSDAGLTPAITPLRRSDPAPMLRARHQLWGARPDDSCARAERDPARCLEGAVLLAGGHLSTPTFWRMDQRDPVMHGEGPKDPEGRELARRAAAEVRSLVERADGGFAPADGRHVAANQAAFATERIDGHTLAEVLGNWTFGRPGPKTVIARGRD